MHAPQPGSTSCHPSIRPTQMAACIPESANDDDDDANRTTPKTSTNLPESQQETTRDFQNNNSPNRSITRAPNFQVSRARYRKHNSAASCTDEPKVAPSAPPSSSTTTCRRRLGGSGPPRVANRINDGRPFVSHRSAPGGSSLLSGPGACPAFCNIFRRSSSLGREFFIQGSFVLAPEPGDRSRRKHPKIEVPRESTKKMKNGGGGGSALGCSWGCLGAILGLSWGHLGPSWIDLEASEGR